MTYFEDIRVLPVRPNWNGRVVSEWSYKTNIFSTRAGSENRRAQRSKPRRRLEFTITEKGDAAAELRAVLARHVNGETVMPDIVRAVPVTVISTTVFQVDDMPSWARSGRPVALLAPGGGVQVRRIVTAVDYQITVDLPASMPAGSKACPALTGRVPEASVRKPSGNSVNFAFTFEEDPTTSLDPWDYLEDDTTPTFRGIPVFAFSPNWVDGLDEDFKNELDRLDYGYGANYFYNPERDAKWSATLPCIAKNRAAVADAERFFFARKGSWKPFYCPTWSCDLRVIDVDGQYVTVAGDAAYYQFHDSLVYRNVAARLATGLWLTGVQTAELSGGDTLFRLDDVVPIGDFVNSQALSWLLMCRFASDQMETMWLTDSVATFSMPVVSVFDRFFELTISGYRIAIGGYYITISPYAYHPSTFIPMSISGEPLLISGDYEG